MTPLEVVILQRDEAREAACEAMEMIINNPPIERQLAWLARSGERWPWLKAMLNERLG
jgi:hypothetical protein